jgi:hypothetical protein
MTKLKVLRIIVRRCCPKQSFKGFTTHLRRGVASVNAAYSHALAVYYRLTTTRVEVAVEDTSNIRNNGIRVQFVLAAEGASHKYLPFHVQLFLSFHFVYRNAH